MKNRNEGSSTDSGALSNPLSLLHSGMYVWSGGYLDYRGTDGDFWLSRAYSTTFSYRLAFFSTFLDPQTSGNRGVGYAVRCVAASSPNPSTISFILAIL